MDWQQISFEVQKSEVDLVSEVLMGIGSISITFSDAQENDIYEPPVGTTPLWEKVTVTALFSSEVSKDSVASTILDICDINKNKFFEDVKNEKIKDELKKLTDIAFKNDIFGAPTFVVNKKIFWGQDRLDYALDEYTS